MSGIFQRLDDALIDGVFQPWIDCSAERLALDCFDQARVCTGLSAIAWILSRSSDMIAAAQSGVVGLQVVQTTLLLLGLAAIMVLHTLFQRAGSGRANPLRLTMHVHRMIVLSGAVVGIVKVAAGRGSLLLLAVSFFATAAVYLGACSKPPPKQRMSRAAGTLAGIAAH